ncbi:MAG: hypothetical protein V3V18_01440 [Methylococcales bacterium]
MIQSYVDYIHYLEEDRLSLRCDKSIKNIVYNDIWLFQRLLRNLEYITNCKKNRLLLLVTKFRYNRLSTKLGFTIPINVFGPGLSIAHRGTIVVNKEVKIGSNCRLHVCVNIGSQAGQGSLSPTIGDNCYIGPGVKIYGAISIADNIAIGANSVVNKSFSESDITIAGVPAKKISNKSSIGLHYNL